MSYTVIDRTKNPKGKSSPNTRRLLKREHSKVREAVEKVIRETGIEDLAKDSPKKIRVKTSGGTEEPIFRHKPGGIREGVFPGNKEFAPGDTIPRPTGGQGGVGGKASPDGEGVDDFVYEMPADEFYKQLFDGLELPDLVKKVISGDEEFILRRAGFATVGPPSRIDLERSLMSSKMRRKAFRIPKIRRKRELEEEKREIEERLKNASGNGQDTEEDEERLRQIKRDIEGIERQIRAIPLFDNSDLQYRRNEREPVPVFKAVMFCVMDVSGSMDEERKDITKRFFTLLYLFLTRAYDHVELVFIRHHATAKEVDEKDFFYSKESGGTVVSTALNLMDEIIKERYPVSEWNIYGAQASDGDNWGDDSGTCRDILIENIMPVVQYYAYVEIRVDKHQNLWKEYEKVQKSFPNFAMQEIQGYPDIYPVFRKLLSPKQKGGD